MTSFLKKYWFTLGLIISFFISFADVTGYFSKAGKFLSENYGPDFVIIFIFLCSGLALNTDDLQDGFKDFNITAAALFIIFIISPFTAWIFLFLPLSQGIAAGLVIVSVMPTTLSSGVVMTAGAGGNKAQALLITIAASFAAAVTIPVSLDLMIGQSSMASGMFDSAGLMFKIGFKVLVPLAAGYIIKLFYDKIADFDNEIQVVSQLLILVMVWMSASAAEQTLAENSGGIFVVCLIVFCFHLALSLICNLQLYLF